MTDTSSSQFDGDIFLQELQRLREEINSLEQRIVSLESFESYDSQDVRYTRLLQEKELLITNLCAIRIKLVDCSSATNPIPLDKYIQPRTFASIAHNVTPRLKSIQLDPPRQVEQVQTCLEQPASAPVVMEVDDNSNTPSDLPHSRLEEYLEKKKEVAAIMRDFTEKKICFFAHDGSAVFPQHYQQIAIRVKEGDDIANCLRGTTLPFVTGVDKKRNSVTEVKLFVPLHEAVRPQPQSQHQPQLPPQQVSNSFSQPLQQPQQQQEQGSNNFNRGYLSSSPSHSYSNNAAAPSWPRTSDLSRYNMRPNSATNNQDPTRNATNSPPDNTSRRETSSTPDQAQSQQGGAWEGFTYK